jgi:hypothetical protein
LTTGGFGAGGLGVGVGAGDDGSADGVGVTGRLGLAGGVEGLPAETGGEDGDEGGAAAGVWQATTSNAMAATPSRARTAGLKGRARWERRVAFMAGRRDRSESCGTTNVVSSARQMT